MDPRYIDASYFESNHGLVNSTGKYLIVGAGFTGLSVAASFERRNISYDLIEKNPQIGGNWFNGVYDRVHIISSKSVTEYKDFPMPDSYPVYPSKQQMLNYLNNFTQHYQLSKTVIFNTKVVSVTPDKDTAKYIVLLDNGEEKLYDGVISCVGHHWNKRMPKYPGTYTGDIMHSKDYKNHHQLSGKRVLVVGGGNSACDINEDAAQFAEEAHMSLRRGYWFLPRNVFGIPLRPNSYYGLPIPDHQIFEVHPTINTGILHWLQLGKIIPHGDIDHFQEKTVHFKDGTSADFDLIIFATGYHNYIPFLGNLVQYKNGIPQLSNLILHPKLKNLMIIGSAQPRYGAGSLLSMVSEIISDLIIVQEKIKTPLVDIFDVLKMNDIQQRTELTADILVDPHEAALKLFLLRRLLLWFPQIEQKLLEYGYLPL
eukprot:TRINITY_DN3470_c0_g1_i2.p1 TRINITY_DN3470_c0_g1~~TRINITY_DN3470_c0_g1_i2.p1  ORF type:complete len:452 (-),score=71.09 TRINITY_DN3470_c0_g1_i2:20-1297(-)